jgi:hypothetical protein
VIAPVGAQCRHQWIDTLHPHSYKLVRTNGRHRRQSVMREIAHPWPRPRPYDSLVVVVPPRARARSARARGRVMGAELRNRAPGRDSKSSGLARPIRYGESSAPLCSQVRRTAYHHPTSRYCGQKSAAGTRHEIRAVTRTLCRGQCGADHDAAKETACAVDKTRPSIVLPGPGAGLPRAGLKPNGGDAISYCWLSLANQRWPTRVVSIQRWL